MTLIPKKDAFYINFNLTYYHYDIIILIIKMSNHI